MNHSQWTKTESNLPTPSHDIILEGWQEGRTGIDLWRYMEERICLACRKEEEYCECEDDEADVRASLVWKIHEGDIADIDLARFWSKVEPPEYWRVYVDPRAE